MLYHFKMRKMIYIAVFIILVAVSAQAEEKIEYFPDQENCELGAYQHCGRLAYLFTKLDEPSFYQKQDGSKGYRFYWSRSFHHQAIIRVDVNPAGNGRLSVKIFDNSRAVNLIEKKEIPLSTEQLADLERHALKVKTWLEAEDTHERSPGTDGAGWCFEIAVEDQFNAGCRWSPQAMPPIRITARNRHIVPDWRRVDADFNALGMKLMELSSVDFGRIY